MNPIRSDDVILDLLKTKCEALEQLLDGEVIFIRAPMAPPVDDAIRHEIEALASRQGSRGQLIVVLETNGGSIETVERISEVFRHHFETVVFVVPNFAYSAGTVLTLSGDEIYMDYYSVLGPIDPQVRNRDGRWVPGIGYLEKYNMLIDKSAKGEMTPAELEFLIRKFDPAELFALQEAQRQSVALIKKWLCKYKFKDWSQRETSGLAVADKDKEERAESIAEILGDPTEWNSHSRGIPLRVLESDKINLKVKNFGDDPHVNSAVRDYYNLIIDYCAKIDIQTCLHTKNGFGSYGG